MNGNTTATALKAGTDWKVSNEFKNRALALNSS